METLKEIIALAMRELKTPTLNYCWKNISPESVRNSNVTYSMFIETKQIINIAHSLGGEGFEYLHKEDIFELINNDNALDKKELLQIADNSQVNDTNTITESSVFVANEYEKQLNLDNLNEGLPLITQADNYFMNIDPSIERLSQFKKNLEKSVAPYV